MKILFVNMSPFFHNTSANVRMCGVIAGMVKNGHLVDLVTLKANEDDYSYDSSKTDFLKKYIHNYFTFEKSGLYQGFKRKNQNDKSIKNLIKIIVKKIYRFFEIYDAQYINVKNIFTINIDYDTYDRIISISDPKSSNKLVYELIKKGKIKNANTRWIQYWGDPWLIDMTKNYGWRSIFIKSEEERLLSKAYKVFYASPITMNAQKAIYTKYSSKMFFVNQPMKNLEDRSQGDKLLHYKEREKKDCLIGYIGAYNSNIRDIRPLYDCCKDNNIELDIVGNGDVSLFNTGFIRVVSGIPQSEAEVAEQYMDVIVCICNISGTQIPGKIFYVAALNKPIIVIVDGDKKQEIKDYLESFSRYILCDNNEKEILKAIFIAKSEIKVRKKYVLSPMLQDTFCAANLIK